MSLKSIILLIGLLGITALGGHVPALRGYYPKDMIDQTGFKGLELVENDQTFICPENLTETFTNGSCHNLRFPFLGVTDSVIIRFGEANFEDGIGSVDEDQVSARLVSNTVVQEPAGLPTNIKDTTRLLIFMGQFIDHDFALTLEQEGEEDGEMLEVPVPDDENDLSEDELEFFRSEFCFVDNQREFTSINTPWLDLGTVYGDNQNLTDLLRTFENGTLNTTIIDDREFPPLNEMGMFICGDIRCEENPQLFAYHTLFLREHNRIALAYQAEVPNATDEEVFQFARLLNINQYHAIIYDFYLPYLIGRRTYDELIGPYVGFIEGVDPTVSNVFTGAVYRYGHSGIPDELLFLDVEGNQVDTTLALPETFLNVESVLESPENLPAIFIGQASEAHALLDQFVVESLRSELFANMPENINAESGMDLIVRNIMRCRDHGCSDINNYRMLFGLDIYECEEDPQDCFTQLTGEDEISAQLFDLYGDIEACDIFICGMAEQAFEDSLLGETFTYIMADQFRRLRDGDRIYYGLIYEDAFDPEFLESINVTFPARLDDLIRNNLAEDLEGTEDFEASFLLEIAYVARLESDVIQVEWNDPPELRGLVEEYDIQVTMPNGNSENFEVPAEDFYLLMTDLEPEMTYTFVVEAVLEDNSREQVGPTLEVTTLAAVSTSTEGTDDGNIGGLAPAAFGGIIGGVAGGVLLIGGGIFLIKRRNRFRNDDINAQFF